MPRLRHFKNFNFTPSDFLDEKENIENETDDKSTKLESSDEDRDASGTHWLSNSFIISTLPSEHIRQAIKYHHAQINLLQDEICAREAGLRSQTQQISAGISFNPSEFTFLPREHKHKASRKERQSSEKTSGSDKFVARVVKLLRKTGLTAEELAALLD